MKDFKYKDTLLSYDQIASIHLYTQETDTLCKDSFYAILNAVLRGENRSLIEPFCSYIFLLLSGARLCPPSTRKTVNRGVKKDLSAEFPVGREFIWYQVFSRPSPT